MPEQKKPDKINKWLVDRSPEIAAANTRRPGFHCVPDDPTVATHSRIPGFPLPWKTGER
jgi:hypothetical protein